MSIIRLLLGLTASRQLLVAGVIVWIVLELWAFALVVSFVGVTGAILLGLLTTVMGMTALRRLGRDAVATMRQAFGRRGASLDQGSVLDGTIAGIGATLLILPGFLTDLIGLALSSPPLRAWLAAEIGRRKGFAAFKRPSSQRHEQVIDLPAQEWRDLDAAPERGRS